MLNEYIYMYVLLSENKFMCLVKDNTREENVHQNNLWPVSELLLIFPVYYFVNGKGNLTRPSFHSQESQHTFSP